MKGADAPYLWTGSQSRGVGAQAGRWTEAGVQELELAERTAESAASLMSSPHRGARLCKFLSKFTLFAHLSKKFSKPFCRLSHLMCKLFYGW
jgi:hypothetical protein